MQNIIESGLSRIWSMQKEHDVGAITAFRGTRTKSQNKANNKTLLAMLLRLDYSITKVKGSYIEHYQKDNAKEVGEESFFVVDINKTGNLETDLRRMGKQFDQDSILYVELGLSGKLIGTSKRNDAYPSYNEVVTVGSYKGGQGGEFFSRIKGRKFAFESVESIHECKIPDTMYGRWALSLVAKNKI